MNPFTRTPKQAEPTHESMPQADPPIMWFATLGGATVEVRHHRFKTNRAGYYSTDRYYEVNGYVWTCLGCGDGGDVPFGCRRKYLDTEQRAARDDANDHAAACRAMPKPEVFR